MGCLLISQAPAFFKISTAPRTKKPPTKCREVSKADVLQRGDNIQSHAAIEKPCCRKLHLHAVNLKAAAAPLRCIKQEAINCLKIP